MLCSCCVPIMRVRLAWIKVTLLCGGKIGLHEGKRVPTTGATDRAAFSAAALSDHADDRSLIAAPSGQAASIASPLYTTCKGSTQHINSSSQSIPSGRQWQQLASFRNRGKTAGQLTGRSSAPTSMTA